MIYEQILTEQRGRVGILTLNRPERLNALTIQLITELYEVVEAFNCDTAVGAVVLTGAGRAFCAGLDVQDWNDPEPSPRQANEPMNYRSSLRWLEIMRQSKPVVAAVNGLAVGGGMSMILSCDIRIASEHAAFQDPHVRLGLVPDMGSSRLLAQTVGFAHAMRLILTGRRINAREAERIGLVTEVVPHDQLLDTAVAIADEIAAHPKSSVLASKQLVWDNLCEADFAKVVYRETEVEEQLMRGPEFREAARAFVEKRRPH